MWISILIAVAIVAFSIGLAVGTFATRFGRGGQTTLPASVQTSTAATIVAALGTPALPPTVTVAASVTATTSPSPTPSPSPSATAACSIQPNVEFGDAYRQDALGCATGAAGVYWAAWEAFELGAMFWRSDTNAAYALLNDGAWLPVDQGWDGQEIPTRGEPPPGLQAPIRGFGYAWATRDELFSRLGWATGEEKGFCALIQPFERGFVLYSDTVEFCQDQLYNTAREPGFTPIRIAVLSNGQWQNRAAAAVTSPSTTPQTRANRPAENGRFVAQARSGERAPRLDGAFSDWPEQWSPIAVVVEGAENFAGPTDLSGAFQVAWSVDGLYFAVRVSDDRYRSGPSGTDMWQGDGLEIQLDRDLLGDFSRQQADADDYQIGVSFGPNGDQLRGYRWLPTNEEASFQLAGVVSAQGEGYNTEFLLPWSIFDLANQNLASQVFGFMISVNDNDQEAPAQQTVLSTSFRRTTYNRPDEWGELVLANE